MNYRGILNRCARCQLPLGPDRTESGHALERCPSCGGVWMETGELLAMLRDAQPRFQFDELLEHNDGSPRLPCPRCGEQMAIVWIDFLRLDQCFAHGVWLDGGELDRALRGEVAPSDLPVPPPESPRYRPPGEATRLERLMFLWRMRVR